MRTVRLTGGRIVQSVNTDIPLLIRLLEYSREDAKSDMDLHRVAERAVRKGKKKLSMKDYNGLVGKSS